MIMNKKMEIKKWDIFLADLEPQCGTEVGKVRPVLVIQTDLLNQVHKSTLICPLSSQVYSHTYITRIFVEKDIGLKTDSDILIDQITAIDNRRLVRKLTVLPEKYWHKVLENISILFDLY